MTSDQIKVSSESGADSGADIWQQVAANAGTTGDGKRELTYAADDWLDSKQRYRLVEAPVVSSDGQSLLDVKVIDTKPDDGTAAALAENAFVVVKPGKASEDATALAEKGTAPPRLPLMAYPYLMLQGRFFPSLPELQQAWVEDDRSVLIIEDRRHLPDLLTVWQQATLDPLQQVHSFYVMVELWEAMSAFKGQGSLLNIGNLCMDEDQIVCLRCIEVGPYRNDYRLADMGLLWQSLLQSNVQSLPDLKDLASQVTEGQLSDIDEMKEMLVAIADKYQLGPDSVATAETASESNPLSD
ncbi:MAG: hypothetical protein AAFY17_08945 [Cyanobacteria bacterium J06642_11]